ncbi:MAG: hypothetical protein A2X49_03810 [Lentisphaerae bacterium GWF2_52_8]|nr:MAG: hypothetical protein A2X49_03810 [Lentisphaerae bacterium GWF2_52_8]
MAKIRVTGLIASLLLAGLQAAAVNLCYAPFEREDYPPSGVLEEETLPWPREKAERVVFKCTPTRNLSFNYENPEIYAGLTVEVSDEAGVSLMSPHYVHHENCAMEIYAVNLNNDNIPDYVIKTNNVTGCGLAAEYTNLCFILSTGDRYGFLQLTTWNAGKHDFIDFDKDGKTEMIHTSFMYGDCKDGKTHSFWVYNLMSFEGTRLVSANRLDKRFPCWIMYSFGDNHKDSELLDGKQRIKIWREAMKVSGNSWEGDRFYGASAFAKEQDKNR